MKQHIYLQTAYWQILQGALLKWFVGVGGGGGGGVGIGKVARANCTAYLYTGKGLFCIWLTIHTLFFSIHVLMKCVICIDAVEKFDTCIPKYTCREVPHACEWALLSENLSIKVTLWVIWHHSLPEWQVDCFTSVHPAPKKYTKPTEGQSPWPCSCSPLGTTYSVTFCGPIVSVTGIS